MNPFVLENGCQQQVKLAVIAGSKAVGHLLKGTGGKARALEQSVNAAPRSNWGRQAKADAVVSARAKRRSTSWTNPIQRAQANRAVSQAEARFRQPSRRGGRQAAQRAELDSLNQAATRTGQRAIVGTAAGAAAVGGGYAGHKQRQRARQLDSRTLG